MPTEVVAPSLPSQRWRLPVPVNQERTPRGARCWHVELEVGFLFSVKSVVSAVNEFIASSVQALAAKTSRCCFNKGGFGTDKLV